MMLIGLMLVLIQGNGGSGNDLLARLENDVSAGKFDNLHGVVVIQNDKVIDEAYFEEFTAATPHDTRSVGKSITALLVGIARDKGLLELDEKVYDIFNDPNTSGDPELADELKVKHLLMMSSGLDAFDDRSDSPGNEDYYQSNVRDWTKHVLALPKAFDPGEKTVYASANYMLLGDLVARVSGTTLEAFAQDHLFDPVGISDVTWFNKPDGTAYGAGGIRLTPRDLAKIGRLVLQDGMWEGKRIVSKSFLREMTQSHRHKVWANKDYGFGWYPHEEKANGKAYRVISAAGNGGQRIWVVAELNAVAVVTMGNYNSGKQRQADEIFLDYLLPSLVQ
jgi:CubicO group peptidase (beta-lactamase class C family)